MLKCKWIVNVCKRVNNYKILYLKFKKWLYKQKVLTFRSETLTVDQNYRTKYTHNILIFLTFIKCIQFRAIAGCRWFCKLKKYRSLMIS